MSLKKYKWIKRRKITVLRLPPPLRDLKAISFVVTNAVPSFENLFTTTIIPSGSVVGIVDPRAIGEVASGGDNSAGIVGFWGEDGGGTVSVGRGKRSASG